MSLIIGINAFHPDSSACALKDGKLIAAVAEEQLGPRLEDVAGFPGRALNAGLRMVGATIRGVDCLAIGNDSNVVFQRLVEVWREVAQPRIVCV